MTRPGEAARMPTVEVVAIVDGSRAASNELERVQRARLNFDISLVSPILLDKRGYFLLGEGPQVANERQENQVRVTGRRELIVQCDDVSRFGQVRDQVRLCRNRVAANLA